MYLNPENICKKAKFKSCKHSVIQLNVGPWNRVVKKIQTKEDCTIGKYYPCYLFRFELFVEKKQNQNRQEEGILKRKFKKVFYKLGFYPNIENLLIN
jgi:hypothetical protein